MKHLKLSVKNIDRLNLIQTLLSASKPLSAADQIFLAKFLSQLPSTQQLLSEKMHLNAEIGISLLTMLKINKGLENWKQLFTNLPGWDYCPHCFFVNYEVPDLLKKKVIISAWFAPSYSYNRLKDRPCEIWLKDDGTALFQLPTLQDAEQYPELYNFKGTWKEAYYLLIETLKKGWPMEEFPDELKQFLKK